MVRVLTRNGTYDYVRRDRLASLVASGYVVAVVS